VDGQDCGEQARLERSAGVDRVIYAGPFLVYGVASVVVGLKTPVGTSPARFAAGVLVSKTGRAPAFVPIFPVSRETRRAGNGCSMRPSAG
jgi:hypothetical protein